VLTEKNQRLYEQIQQREEEEARQMQQLQTEPEERLTSSQQLFRRLCKLMDDEKPYTDDTLNRETLARMLSTNYKYVEQAIRECSNGETVADFINRYRIQQAAVLLKTTDDSVGLIGELCGIGSRTTLFRLFRDHYGMSPSEYRKISQH
jgi:AraC-like DNA-binding protein